VHGTVGETEDLEAAAVGDERTARPIDEFVKSSGSFDDVGSGLEEEVVSVAEYELLVGGVGVSEVYSFEGCVGCDCDVSRLLLLLLLMFVLLLVLLLLFEFAFVLVLLCH